MNDNDNDLSASCKKLLKNHDPVYIEIMDLYLNGHTQLEIAGKIEKSLITVKRLFKQLAKMLKPLTTDIADYIRLQDSAPSYTWAASHKVNLPKLDRSTTIASVPGTTVDTSCKNKDLEWLFTDKRDITKIS